MAPETPDDEPLLTGPALGEDGRVHPPAHAPEDEPLPGASVRGGFRAPSPPTLAPVFETTGAHVVSEPEVPSIAPVPSAALRDMPAAAHEAPLELADRAPRPPPDDAPLPRAPRPARWGGLPWGRWAVGLALTGFVGWAGFTALTSGTARLGAWLKALPALLPGSASPLKPGDATQDGKSVRVGTPAPTLLVTSEPSGATVLVGGAEVGVTPWAGDNVWPSGDLVVEVRKAGYRAWRGTTPGGAQGTLRAKLTRR